MHNSIVLSGDETKCISAAGCHEGESWGQNTGEYLGYLGSQQILGGSAGREAFEYIDTQG